MIQKLHTPLLDRIMLSITFLGDPLVMLISSLRLAISPLYYNRRWEATILGIAGVGAILLEPIPLVHSIFECTVQRKIPAIELNGNTSQYGSA
ncbi:hypothetical protein [Nostoc sp.]|uniref:hypothetical protein n=1 Tax=Nostoc sp. TaxID=1180 RepID=UPI003FA5A011